jgi:hypothetical protein
MGGDPAPQRTRYPLFGANRRRSPTPICPLSRSIPSAETKPDTCSVATQARFTVQRLSRGNLLKHGRGSEARGCDTHSSGLFRRYATPALWDGARRRPFYDRVGASHAGALASRERVRGPTLLASGRGAPGPPTSPGDPGHIGRRGIGLSGSYRQGYSTAYNARSHIKVVCNGYILAHVSNCIPRGPRRTLPPVGGSPPCTTHGRSLSVSS